MSFYAKSGGARVAGGVRLRAARQALPLRFSMRNPCRSMRNQGRLLALKPKMEHEMRLLGSHRIFVVVICEISVFLGKAGGARVARGVRLRAARHPLPLRLCDLMLHCSH